MTSPTYCDLVDQIRDRAGWLAWRREGLGASDIGAICGMSQWATPTSVFLEKVGLLDGDAALSEAARWGSLLEEPIAREFEIREGLYVDDPQLCVRDTVHSHRRCTLDGLVYEAPNTTRASRDYAVGLLEIKCSRDRPWDTVPDTYAIQVQWQLGVTGKTHAWLAVLHGGNTLRTYEFDFDEILFAHLARIADRFWTDNVLAENPPPADGSEATTEALKDAYRDRATDTAVVFDDLYLDVARTWLAAEQAVKDAEHFRDRAKNQLRSILGENTAGVDGQGDELVTWKPQNGAAPFDKAALRRDHPDLFTAYSGDQPTVRVLRATKALKELAGFNEGA